MESITVQRVIKPCRRVIIKRGISARDYFAYCEEVGCDIWDQLLSMDCGEPVCLWLPEKLIAPGTSQYVQGVEVSPEDPRPLPEGLDEILLPEAEYLLFQGQPFLEETFAEAIEEVWSFMDQYDPSVLGYQWDNENPRIQLEPRCERGYVELRAVKKISQK